jgi:hypothetical protein
MHYYILLQYYYVITSSLLRHYYIGLQYYYILLFVHFLFLLLHHYYQLLQMSLLQNRNYFQLLPLLRITFLGNLQMLLQAATTGRTGLLEHGPQCRPFRDYGTDGAADGLSQSTPRHADDTAMRPSGEQADASVRCIGTRSQHYMPKVRRGLGRIRC